MATIAYEGRRVLTIPAPVTRKSHKLLPGRRAIPTIWFVVRKGFKHSIGKRVLVQKTSLSFYWR